MPCLCGETSMPSLITGRNKSLKFLGDGNFMILKIPELLLRNIKDTPVSVFWFRRDLRLDDNCGLFHALKSGWPVLPVFIFDDLILDDLQDKEDRRVAFIHHYLGQLNAELIKKNSSLLILKGKPDEVWKTLIHKLQIRAVYANHDYEPYAIKRDEIIQKLLQAENIPFHTFKDQVIFEKNEILSSQGKPLTIFTPYKNRWLSRLQIEAVAGYLSERQDNYIRFQQPLFFPSLKDIGFSEANWAFPKRAIPLDLIKAYHEQRDIPGIAGTTRLGVHLRFGTISVRELVRQAMALNEVWLNELIWREFFMMILWQFPRVVGQAFKERFNAIHWRDADDEFERWCLGQTGYPLVDAGMRELNETGFMHNRVRMVTASFLVKHLLIDWRKGQNYFAAKLLDFELASNNGNWQWAAGCGCDAVPYFRIFNPALQQQKFDSKLEYIRRWVPEYDTTNYPMPVVEHSFARQRALQVLSSGK